MTMDPLPFASIENHFLRVDYLTTVGPRIIGLHTKGVDGNLLAETPDVHWPTPHGEYYLYGGHRLWTAPEDHVKVTTDENKVILQSDVDASGLEKEIALLLNENCVELTHRVIWHGKGSIELAPWGITQLRLESLAILPQSDSDGLQPNRNLIFWPFSQVDDERLEFYDDLILIHGRRSEQAFKIGNGNSHGWLACLLGNVLFVKRFTVSNTRQYPDMGCNAEVYVKDSCLELETLGPLRTLQPNESMTHTEIWEVTVGEYPATLETARRISKQLSLKQKMNGETNGKQN